MPEEVHGLGVQRVYARKDVPGVGKYANGDDTKGDTVRASYASGTRRRKHRQ